jgi:hypothetical protein
LPGASGPSAAKALEIVIVIATRAAPIARMSLSNYCGVSFIRRSLIKSSHGEILVKGEASIAHE